MTVARADVLDTISEDDGAVNYETTWNTAAELQDKVPIFDLTESERARLVSHMRVRRLRRRQVVYERGDVGDDIFVIHTGFVKSFVRDKRGGEVVFSLLARGQFFGTLSLSRRTERDSSIVALVPTTLLQILRVDALEVMQRNKKAMSFMVDRFAETIRERDETIAVLVLRSGSARLARLLLELERLGVMLSQEDMGATIGLSREQVNRRLADFARRGLIALEHPKLRILDPAGLRNEMRI